MGKEGLVRKMAYGKSTPTRRWGYEAGAWTDEDNKEGLGAEWEQRKKVSSEGWTKKPTGGARIQHGASLMRRGWLYGLAPRSAGG